MRQSQLFATTLREAPAEAETASHRLLLRAGYIRQLAAGIYTYLPLGQRVLRKLEGIVRQEMEAAGAQELLMPSMQPAELWQASERYEVYGKELIKLQDRHEREFVLGPTHEEVITSLVRGELASYRRLPVTLFQIQTKFRDERRPRSGLLRGREFLMKDAYSFDPDWEGLDASYTRMFEAYQRIFDRCGLDYRAVHADSGAIGGEGGSHEFMAIAGIGEDTIAVCPACGYAANLEQAEASAAEVTAMHADEAGRPLLERFHTPGIRTIGELHDRLGIVPEQIIKTLIYTGGGQSFAVLVRGDHEVNEIKLQKTTGITGLVLAEHGAVAGLAGVESGFVGPVGLELTLLVDAAVAAMPYGIAGAGVKDYHLRGVVPGRDFVLSHVGDFRNVVEGEACPQCGAASLNFEQGIEIGHVFKLGTKYSEKLGASYLDASGTSRPMIMGCYGIGISRLLSAIAEQNHDEEGLIWPAALSPYQVHILQMSMKDTEQTAAAEELYGTLTRAGIETLLDERDERAGVKFKDAGLMGIPVTVVVGKDAAGRKVEWKSRRESVKELISLEEGVSRILALKGSGGITQ
ncbi:proline--tRNA ligase [Paenibacillus tengchongensis]|uniref:proline--tRNA ligase n=1 Tax=Paenibacillus tengchongensis TaxID=2608684 RepID=UPI00124ED69A|nr:proline--tRNA ligase [Paenibacillus tengchongensis]